MFDRVLRGVCAGFVLLFGLWTVLANVAVQLDLGFTDLRSLSWLVPIAATAAVAAAYRFRGKGIGEDSTTATEERDFSNNWPGLIIAVALSTGYVLTRHYTLFWGLACLYLGASYIAHLKGASLKVLPVRSRPSDILLFSLAALIAVTATMVIHRPDADDSLYINMAVSVLDTPSGPMLATDTLHAIPGGFYLPTYRVHSIELLFALLADVAGIEPIQVAHLILPAGFALLSVCASARFLRVFLGRYWAWATVALVMILLVARQTHLMYGNFAYVRLFQGKAVFVTLMIPLIITYAVEFFVRPRATSWVLLALAQVGAVGLTANALYGAPIAAGLALGGCWRPSWAATRQLGVGLLTTLYPLVLGLWVRQEIARNMLRTDLVGAEFVPLNDAMGQFFGSGATQLLWLVALIGAWSVLGDPARRRWVLGVSFVFMLLFMNPFLDKFWAANLTGVHLIWRLFWALPLPVLLVMLLTPTLSFGSGKGSAMGRFSFVATLLVMSAYVFGPPYSNQPNGELVLGRPHLKVPTKAYSTAETLVRLTGPGEMVLAPEEVSTWVTTFRGYPYPVVSREIYATGQLRVFSGWVDRQLLLDRLELLHYVSGIRRTPESTALLARSLRVMPINAVAAPTRLEWLSELSAVLEEAGFISRSYLDYVIFYRGQEWPADISPLLEQG